MRARKIDTTKQIAKLEEEIALVRDGLSFVEETLGDAIGADAGFRNGAARALASSCAKHMRFLRQEAECARRERDLLLEALREVARQADDLSRAAVEDARAWEKGSGK